MKKLKIHLNNVLALVSRHKFIVEHTVESIKGSHNSVYEYGPLGTALRKNLRQLWWRDVVINKERVNGIESSMFEQENESILTESNDGHGPARKHCYVLGDLEKLVNELSLMSHTKKDDTKDHLKELILRNTISVKARNSSTSNGLHMYKTFLAADSKFSLPQGFAWNGKYVAMENDETNFLR